MRPSFFFCRSGVQEWLRRRSGEQGEEVWVPATYEAFHPSSHQGARDRLQQAQDALQQARDSKAMDLWREDLQRVMPLLEEAWNKPVWQ